MTAMTRTNIIKAILLIGAFAAGAGYLGRVYMRATSPSSVKVTVLKVELLAGRSDTDPIVLFSDPAGRDLDLVRDMGDFTLPAATAPGTFTTIRLTVRNAYAMSITNKKENPCKGEVFTDRRFSFVDGKEDNAPVPIYFASAADGGATWAGSQVINFLARPVIVRPRDTTLVRLRFITEDTLFCPRGDVERRAPWSVWNDMQ